VARHVSQRSLRPSRIRTVLGTSAVGAALAVGGAFTAHAAAGSTKPMTAKELDPQHSGVSAQPMPGTHGPGGSVSAQPMPGPYGPHTHPVAKPMTLEEANKLGIRR
jgi:hypothetical protein